MPIPYAFILTSGVRTSTYIADRDAVASVVFKKRNLRIPMGQVLSSPTYRALETARQARLPIPRTFDQLGDNGKGMNEDSGSMRGAWLRSRVAQGAKPGTNTVIITHYPNITDAFASDAKNLAEGEALIFRPDGRGGASLIGRVKIDDWSKLTATETEAVRK